jgi:hypothetical protein
MNVTNRRCETTTNKIKSKDDKPKVKENSQPDTLKNALVKKKQKKIKVKIKFKHNYHHTHHSEIITQWQNVDV